MKTCCKCKIELTINSFYKDLKKKDGLRPNCKNCQNNIVAEYSVINKDVILRKQREYYEKNRINILAKKKSNNKQNSKKALNYYHTVRKHDFVYRLNASMTSGIYKSLKEMKMGKSWEKMTGYTLKDLIEKLEPLLKPGMSLDNYGYVWHIDHIKPKSKCSSFDETWNINNLQPLFREENLRKSNKY
jgi:hypothetical protein